MAKKAAKKIAATVRHSPMEHPRHQYPQETTELQRIARDCGLVEKIKWGKPCFTLGNKNIVLIQRFNLYIALLFFKGGLINDPEGLLARIGGNMQTPRQLRFTSVAEIVRMEPTIRAYIEQAIEVEKSGAKVPRKTVADLDMPGELASAFAANAGLRKAFAALTPGRQKAYIYHIGAAKQTATRAARVSKLTPQILAGKGLMD